MDWKRHTIFEGNEKKKCETKGKPSKVCFFGSAIRCKISMNQIEIFHTQFTMNFFVSFAVFVCVDCVKLPLPSTKVIFVISVNGLFSTAQF